MGTSTSGRCCPEAEQGHPPNPGGNRPGRPRSPRPRRPRGRRAPGSVLARTTRWEAPQPSGRHFSGLARVPAGGSGHAKSRGGRFPRIRGAPAIRRGGGRGGRPPVRRPGGGRRRPASPVPEPPDRVPVSLSPVPTAVVVGAVWSGRSGQRPGDGGRPGAGTGECLGTSPWRIRTTGRQRRTRLRLPEGSARCPPGAVGGGVEARSVVQRSRSAAGGAPSGVSHVAAGIGLEAAGNAETERRSAIARGRGRPVSACSGGAENGVQRPAAVVAHRAVRRGTRPFRDVEQVLAGTSSSRSPGTLLGAPAEAIP
jgi:hypothetical protein